MLNLVFFIQVEDGANEACHIGGRIFGAPSTIRSRSSGRLWIDNEFRSTCSFTLVQLKVHVSNLSMITECETRCVCVERNNHLNYCMLTTEMSSVEFTRQMIHIKGPRLQGLNVFSS